MDRIFQESLIQPAQKTPEWLAKRLTGISATDYHTIAFGNHKQLHELIMKKIGKPIKPFLGNHMTEHGVFYESEAIEKFKLLYPHVKVRDDVSMIEHTEKKGTFFSPDGVTLAGDLLEVKCPYSRPINGSIPTNYISQVQYGMYVMNSHGQEIGNQCYFIQYKPKNFGKPFDRQILSVKIIPRDETYVTSKFDKIDKFKKCVEDYRSFHDHFNENEFFLAEEN